MKEVIDELNAIVLDFTGKFSRFTEEELAAKPAVNKWSKKEVIGHLIDSAQNNLRRFIVGQYEQQPKIVYEQEFWVKSVNYQQMNGRDVIELWRLVNAQISNVLASMPSENYSRMCRTDKQSDQTRSLEWLASDYVKHLKHHINQVVHHSFDIVYP